MILRNLSLEPHLIAGVVNSSFNHFFSTSYPIIWIPTGRLLVYYPSRSWSYLPFLPGSIQPSGMVPTSLVLFCSEQSVSFSNNVYFIRSRTCSIASLPCDLYHAQSNSHFKSSIQLVIILAVVFIAPKHFRHSPSRCLDLDQLPFVHVPTVTSHWELHVTFFQCTALKDADMNHGGGPGALGALVLVPIAIVCSITFVAVKTSEVVEAKWTHLKARIIRRRAVRHKRTTSDSSDEQLRNWYRSDQPENTRSSWDQGGEA